MDLPEKVVIQPPWKIFLDPHLDYKIYCRLKYASYLHVIHAPKSWQGMTPLQILWAWNTLLGRVVRNEWSMPRSNGKSTVLNWQGKVVDDWSWTHLPLLAIISIWPRKILDPHMYSDILTANLFWIHTCLDNKTNFNWVTFNK